MIVAGIYFVGSFVGAIRTQINRETLAYEYQQYFYEAYELPSEPMFSSESTPMERLGNRTREMLRYLLNAQSYAADIEGQWIEQGAYRHAAFSSESKFRKALDLLDSLAREYANMAEAYADVPKKFLAGSRRVATDSESKRFFKEQEQFHVAEAAIYAEESKVIQRIVRLEKERALLLWGNRRYLIADEQGYTSLANGAPRDLVVRLREIDRRIGEQEQAREELRRKLQGVFNKFYYIVTGQREDFMD